MRANDWRNRYYVNNRSKKKRRATPMRKKTNRIMAFDQILKFFNKDPNEIMPGNSFESFKQSYISERNLHDGGIDQISELLKKVILEQSLLT